jgi:hypothetical protein
MDVYFIDYPSGNQKIIVKDTGSLISKTITCNNNNT